MFTATVITNFETMNFDLLGELRAHDILRITFRPEQLLVLEWLKPFIERGLFETQQQSEIDAILTCADWAGHNRTFELRFMDAFDIDDLWSFEALFTEHVEHLEVCWHSQPVQNDVLSHEMATFRYQFRTEVHSETIKTLLRLCTSGALQLSNRSALIALADSSSPVDEPIIGRFTVRNVTPQADACFIAHIAPHLTFCRRKV